MATPVGQNAFVPKQAITKDVDLYAEITANSTRDVARAILDFLPPIPANAKIHDNGCGSGEVTSAILERLTTAQDAATAVRGPGVSIEATDIDDSYLDRLRANLHDAHDEQPAEVTVSHMPAEQLAFAADHFDLSIANFVVFLTPEEGLPALRHMHRTLKTGGTAVVTAWARLPHVDPVRAAHLATRAGSAGDVGPDTETHHPGPPPPPLREIPPQWWSGPYLRDAVVRAGFDEGRVALRSVTVSITARDERHLARVLWSYLGPPVTGWLPSDEARWDEAMDVIVHSFGQMEGFQRLEGEGGLRIELTANVVLATKLAPPPPTENVWYLAYGSNLSSSKFIHDRGIVPLATAVVTVPGWSLAMDSAGVPYSEPAFASISPIGEGGGGLRDEKRVQLIGTAYQVTPEMYTKILASEGGGIAYAEVEVRAQRLDVDGILGGDPETPPADATFATRSLVTVLRRKARPSARYMNLLLSGAAEARMPAAYQEFLERIPRYPPPSEAVTRMGAAIFLGFWVPVMSAMERLTKASLRRSKTGNAPDWVVLIVRAVVIAMWLYHDYVHAPIWGRGD